MENEVISKSSIGKRSSFKIVYWKTKLFKNLVIENEVIFKKS